MRAQLYGAFATLSLGMRVLAREGVEVDSMFAHGGLFRTEGVAQRLLAAAVGTPVSVGRAPGEGGAWGIAVLAGYLAHASDLDLATYLDQRIFAGAAFTVARPIPADVDGFGVFLDRYVAGLAIEAAAVQAL
jgi:sugar (pentulose or hexulose) kinase